MPEPPIAAPSSLPLHLFDYDAAAPLEPEERSLGVNEALRWSHLWISSAGRRVPGVLVTADGPAPGRRPAILLQHGAGTSKYARFVTACVDLLAGAGFVCLALDAVGHGEREDSPRSGDPAWESFRRSPDFVVRNVVDFRRGLDYLASRPDVDAGRLAYAGSSMGAMLGAFLCAADSRPQAVVLRCSGARPLSAGASGSPDLQHLGFAAGIAPRPVLMLNNTEDEVFDRESVLRLYGALGDPKELRWFPGDHRDNRELHAAECLEWLQRWLG